MYSTNIFNIEKRVLWDALNEYMKNEEYLIWPNLKTLNVSLSPALEIQTEKEGKMEDRWYYTNN